MNNKNKFELVARNETEYELYLVGDIDKWSRASSSDVLYGIDEAKRKGAKKVILKIHSPGGSVDEGMAIYNSLLESKKQIKIDADIIGICGSMMSVVIQACDDIIMSDVGMFMVHSARTNMYGATEKELLSMIALLQKINSQFADVFAQKTGKEKQWILDNWLNGDDYYFSPQEALENGFVTKLKKTELTEEETAKAKMLLNISATADKSEFLNKYQEYFNKKFLINKAPKEDTMDTTQKNDELKALVKELGLPEAKANVQGLTDFVKKLKEENEKLKQAEQETKLEKLKSLCSEKKLSEAITKEMLALAKSDYEGVKSLVEKMSSTPLDLKSHFEGNAKTTGEGKDYKWYAKNKPETLAEWAENNSPNFKKLLKGELV